MGRKHVVCLIGLALCAGCATAPEKDDPLETFRQQQEQKKLQQAREQDPFLASQTDVEIAASWAQPGRLQVTVMNRLDKPLEVGPACFGLITPPSREVAETLPESKKTFPVITLKPGEQASGLLVFKVGDSHDARLAFRHPQARPAMARIH